MPTVFDGTARTMTIDSGSPNVVMRELYSEWKQWVKVGDNSKYLSAFRTIGGDPTVAGQTAPAYFFATNGWKAVVDGFDATFSVNFYSSDGSSPVITLNDGTAQLFNSDVGIVQGGVDIAALQLSLEIINQGIQKSSLLIPHTDNLP